jgi:hypothetical protein
MDRLAKQQACQLFIEQEIEKGLTAGKTTYKIGKEVAGWIQKLFQAKVEPNTIRVRADRMLCTNVHKSNTKIKYRHSRDGHPAKFVAQKDWVYSCQDGDNSKLIAKVASLYLKDGQVIADVTYGKGVFWKRVDTSRFDFRPSDILSCENKYDFCNLPYKDGEIDILVFDPPYLHNPGNMVFDENYRNGDTTKGMSHEDIINLYRRGMEEGFRVLKAGGQLWAKCKDEMEGVQRWNHIEIYDIAKEIGFHAEDLFVLVYKYPPMPHQVERQRHARKNHSYLWIFVV